MKRWIHSATEVKTYRNKRNPNKYVEVHEDGYGHRSAKQYMEWDNGVKNELGDTNLHRWKKGNMEDLLEDYEEVESATSVTNLDDEVDDMLADKYNVVYKMDNDIEGLGGRGGSVVLMKVDDSEFEQNVYRIFIDTKYNKLIFQVLQDAWVDGEDEYYNDAIDFNHCSIEGMSAVDVFQTIEEYVDNVEATKPNFTQWKIISDDPSGEGTSIPACTNVSASSDYEDYLADQHTSDNSFGNPGYAEAQSDEEIYSRVESLGWNDAEQNIPQKTYSEFCKVCNENGINCNERWFRVYKNAYESMLNQLLRSVDASDNVCASDWQDDPNADMYVVKISYEIEPEYDAPNGPQAAEEIIQTVAASPEEAIEYAKKQWSGPIDRIEVVDINPEDSEDEIPFEASTDINSRVAEWFTVDSYPEIDPVRINAVYDIDWNINPEDVEIFLTEESTFPDLTQLAQVSYFDDNQKKWAEDNGYDWGYNVIYEDGAEKQFAWLPYPRNMEPLTDVTEDAPEAITGSTAVEANSKNLSQCSFDFDLGPDYDQDYIDNELTDIFEDLGAEVTGTDYHSVDYTLEGDPRLYSQCTVDYVWHEPIDGDALEYAISELINDQGGNFFGLDVYSLQ